MTESSKRTDSSMTNEKDDEEPDVRSVKLKYMKSLSPRRKKSSGLSSDEETSSSSLLPIPDTLKHMRGELKRIIDDAEGPVKNSLRSSSRIGTEDVHDSLKELRRKYSINEASVTMKMNSANLMLDDILSENNLNIRPGDTNFQQKLIQHSDFKAKNVQELDTSSIAESVSTTKNCDHLPPTVPSLAHRESLSIPHHCCKIQKKFYRPICTCNNNFYGKGLQVKVIGNDFEKKQKKLSVLEKFQNLHLGCRIQSVCKIVQKNNPFNNKSRKDDSSINEQGISHEESLMKGQDCSKQKLGHQNCQRNHYPRRMVFDLVESSEVSLLDERSECREEINCLCPLDIKCTCQSQKDCTCPELTPVQCTCSDSPKISFTESDCCCCLKNPPSNSKACLKVNEFVQTDFRQGSMHAQEKESRVELNQTVENSNLQSTGHAKSETVVHTPPQSLGVDHANNIFPSHHVNKQFQREMSANSHVDDESTARYLKKKNPRDPYGEAGFQ